MAGAINKEQTDLEIMKSEIGKMYHEVTKYNKIKEALRRQVDEQNDGISEANLKIAHLRYQLNTTKQEIQSLNQQKIIQKWWMRVLQEWRQELVITARKHKKIIK